ncbi:MAG: phage portal protein [Phycisphaerae bacterium]|nr:phage portal protein [Planctomycetia bacterium]MCL4719371.1 phage portal protein [Phycisphaerae bacterium]
MPMLKRIREWMLGGRDRNGSRPGLRFLRFRTPDSRLQAKYDAAQTTPENRRHWAHADHLSANAAASPEVRRILRSRARYEVANNSYAKGIVLTLANYVVGTGPRLQMLTDDPEANRIIEKEFSRWAKVTGLSHKLRTMRIAQCETGECFGLLSTNPRVEAPAQLDLRLIEADQVCTPWPAPVRLRNTGVADAVDGIIFDEFGNPIAYTILRHHPGDNSSFRSAGFDYDITPVESVIHLFRAERPGQSRGIPEITSSLSLFAMLRRYTLAVLGSAEQAALPSGVIYTDAPADAEASGVEPMDQVEMDRGTWMTMPYGWKIGQVKAEQPTTMYGDFKHEVINEIARCLNMPFNIAAGNSSGYNYASGRLDHQAFFKAIRIDQAYLGDVVLDRILKAWLDEAVLIEGYLPQSVRTLDFDLAHQWFWDGLEHVDPQKEANAQSTRLASHTTTLAAEYAKAGLDWESELRQRAREVALMRELGLNTEQTAPAPEDEEREDEDDVTEDVDAHQAA